MKSISIFLCLWGVLLLSPGCRLERELDLPTAIQELYESEFLSADTRVKLVESMDAGEINSKATFFQELDSIWREEYEWKYYFVDLFEGGAEDDALSHPELEADTNIQVIGIGEPPKKDPYEAMVGILWKNGLLDKDLEDVLEQQLTSEVMFFDLKLVRLAKEYYGNSVD